MSKNRKNVFDLKNTKAKENGNQTLFYYNSDREMWECDDNILAPNRFFKEVGIPLMVFSTNPVWDEICAQRLEDEESRSHFLLWRELKMLPNPYTLRRLRMNPDTLALYSWDSFVEKKGVCKELQHHIERVANLWGSDTKEWRLCMEPVQTDCGTVVESWNWENDRWVENSFCSPFHDNIKNRRNFADPWQTFAANAIAVEAEGRPEWDEN